ncbi:MAG: hypothetical protein INR73_25240 [Williamsia sp.]|nr:hypothetical protein [Williamsia sp.]
MKTLLLLTILFGSIAFVACKKESLITSKDAGIVLSADTLRFDTVFTSVGSVTQYFTLKNGNHQKLHVSGIRLTGGAASAFKINVDGTAGPEVKDLEIEADDSLYVFVSANLDANNSNLPFIVRDSVEINWNGNQQFVQLESWGQNANFLRARRITGNTTWTNKLPYVILGGIQVDTNAVLTIEPGCRIYLHADAPFIVDGTLRVNGNAADSMRVYFRGDRLDEPYKAYPAGWPGIYFRGTSKNNVLNWAVVQNAYQAIVTEQPATTAAAKLQLNQCIIDNAYDAGILGVQSSINATNCLISNCGKGIQLVLGGSYQFTHCTVAAYSSTYGVHKEPVLFASNFIKQDNNLISANLEAGFRNCIFWGDSGTVKDEVVVSKQGTGVLNASFQNCLYRVSKQPDNITASNNISNQPPLFDSLNPQKHYFNFRLKEGSPARDKGTITGLAVDLDGKSRNVGLPDIGAYERQ